MSNLSIFNKDNKIDVLKNPFDKDKITNISLSYRKVMFEKIFSWTARVEFTNGNTSGSQRFEVKDSTEYNSFEVITKQIQEFIDSL
jgi:hypothetical protein